MTGEVKEVIDPANEPETMHPLIEIPDVHAGAFLDVSWRCFWLALKVDFYYLFVDR